MSRYTVTIRTFLLSRFVDEFGKKNGLSVSPDGDYYHMNTIIDETYNEVFKDMQLLEAVDTQFKKEFCRRFYNREIGYETFARFQVAFEGFLNTTCFNLFKFRATLMNMEIEDSTLTNNTTSTATGDSKSLAITSTQPQNDLAILYPEGTGTIRYADALGENYGNQDSSTNVVGTNGRPLFEQLSLNAQIVPIDEQIFLKADQTLFMQVYDW